MVSSFAAAWTEAIVRDSWVTTEPWLLFGSVAAVGEVLGFWKRDGWSTERINSR
jgi:hypothetical protein